VKLRFPNDGDLPGILRLGRAMHAESWYRDFDYSEAKLSGLFQTILTHSDFIGLIAEDKGEIMGFLAGALTEHFFGTDRYACDLCLYVTPEHRGSFTALRLIRAYEAWCRIKGVKEIHIGVSSDVSADRTGLFYQKLGFTSFSTGYRKKCVSGSEPRA
jgi:GNAT superfamily N-acetyltransferase